MRRAVRHNPEPTAREILAIAADAMKESKMVKGERAKALKKQARDLYDEALKLPHAQSVFVPPALQHWKYDGKINIDEIAEMFGLPKWDVISERNMEYFWETGAQMVDEADFVDDEQGLQDARDAASGEAEGEMFRQWHNAVMSVADGMFAEVSLTLEPIYVNKAARKHPAWEFEVTPRNLARNKWEAPAKALMEIINGDYGNGESIRELMKSGPYASVKITVLAHLHDIARGPMVFGGPTPRQLYDQAFR